RRGEVADPAQVPQQLVLGVEPAPVEEVVALDGGEGQGEVLLLVAADQPGVGEQLAGGALPAAPGPGRGQPRRRVRPGEAAVVGAEQVAPFSLGDGGQVALPGVREEGAAAALVEPVDLLPAQEEDAAH